MESTEEAVMKTAMLQVLALILLASSAQAELRRVEMTVFGMD
jgi:hypothetical protein